MPICQNCNHKWTWKQTIKQTFKVSSRMICSSCGTAQYVTKRTRLMTTIFYLITGLVTSFVLTLYHHNLTILISNIAICLLFITFYPSWAKLTSKEDKVFPLAKWNGSAAICFNERNEVLMVLQGKPHEEKKWAVPAGGLFDGETFEQACIRETLEETGYVVEIEQEFYVKEDHSIELRYYFVKIIGGTMAIQDPDELIHEIAWRPIDEVHEEELCFPEDRKIIINALVEHNQ